MVSERNPTKTERRTQRRFQRRKAAAQVREVLGEAADMIEDLSKYRTEPTRSKAMQLVGRLRGLRDSLG